MRLTADALQRYARWLLVAILVFSILWKGGKGLEATWLLAGFGIFVTFLFWWKSSEREQTVSWTVWILLMSFVLWTVVSFLFSTTQNYGLDEVVRDVGLVFLLLWVVRTRTEALASRIIATITLCTLAASLIGIAVYVFQPVNRLVGTFFDFRFHTDYWPNAWAEYLLLAWPLVAVGTRGARGILRVLVIGLTVAALFLSYSRGAFLVFTGQLVLLGIFFVLFKRGSLGHWKKGAFLALGTLAVALGLFFGVNALRGQFHPVQSVSEKATFTAQEGASSISEREQFFRQALSLSWQRPLFGWGPYSFRFVQPRFQQEVFATSDHPHNVFLKLAMERGWIAAMLFIAALGWMLIPVLKRTLIARDDVFSLQTAGFLSVAGVFAHTLIDFNLQFVGIALPLWLLIGFIIPQETSYKNKKIVRTFELALGLIIGCVLIWEARGLVVSSLGRHAEASGKSHEALLWYDRARPEVFSRDMHLSRAHLYLEAGDIPSAMSAVDQYEEANAQDARSKLLRARAALARQDLPGALVAYTQALESGKYNYLEALDGFLWIHMVQQEPLSPDDQAMAEEIFQKFGDAILQNSHFIALTDNVEAFDRVALSLMTLVPQHAEKYDEYAQRVIQHANEERENYDSRAPGLLW